MSDSDDESPPPITNVNLPHKRADGTWHLPFISSSFNHKSDNMLLNDLPPPLLSLNAIPSSTNNSKDGLKDLKSSNKFRKPVWRSAKLNLDGGEDGRRKRNLSGLHLMRALTDRTRLGSCDSNTSNNRQEITVYKEFELEVNKIKEIDKKDMETKNMEAIKREQDLNPPVSKSGKKSESVKTVTGKRNSKGKSDK